MTVDWGLRTAVERGFEKLQQSMIEEARKDRMVKLMAQGMTATDAKELILELDKIF